MAAPSSAIPTRSSSILARYRLYHPAHSGYGARAGPTPSWTNPLAIARYPLHPLGLEKHKSSSLEDNGSSMRRPARATIESGPTHLGLQKHPRVASALALTDGDLVEVEQWGGWLGADTCPPICGLWANLWRGTGIAIRLHKPFTSLNKATALVELLVELGHRDPNALMDVAQSIGLKDDAATIRNDHPSATPAACLVAVLLRRHPCHGTGDANKFDNVVEMDGRRVRPSARRSGQRLPLPRQQYMALKTSPPPIRIQCCRGIAYRCLEIRSAMRSIGYGARAASAALASISC